MCINRSRPYSGAQGRADAHAHATGRAIGGIRRTAACHADSVRLR
jgi:hypothetical protein